jgi:hypothetical protein
MQPSGAAPPRRGARNLIDFETAGRVIAEVGATLHATVPPPAACTEESAGKNA